jgi:hypothetical protein
MGALLKVLYPAFITLCIPIRLMNAIGAIVSGIWLAAIGELDIVIVGLVLYVCAHIVLKLAIAPGLPLAELAYRCAIKENIFGSAAIGVVGNIYLHLVITAWVCAILYAFTLPLTESNQIPMLIWSYGVAIRPWIRILYADPPISCDDKSTMAVWCAQASYIVAIASIMLGLAISSAIILLGVLMAFGAITQSIVICCTLMGMRREMRDAESEDLGEC